MKWSIEKSSDVQGEQTWWMPSI